MSVRRSINYAFTATRVSALKGKLLTRGAVTGLADAGSLEELVARLKETPYSAYVEALKAPHTATEVENALLRRYIEELNALAKGAPALSALLAKERAKLYLYEALKILLKGKLAGKTPKEIEESLSLFQGLYPEMSVLIGAAYAGDIASVVDALKAVKMDEVAGRAVSLYQEQGVPALVDATIDYEYLRRQVDLVKNMSADEKLYTEPLLRLECEIYNILAIARSKQWRLPGDVVRRFLTPVRWRLASEEYSALIAAERIEDCIAVIKKSWYKDVAAEDLGSLEKGLLELQVRKAYEAFYTDRFHPGMIIAYSKLLQVEIMSLITLIYGIEMRIPQQEVLREIMVL